MQNMHSAPSGHCMDERHALIVEAAGKLSRIDLNLFTVFRAIYREGGITLASKRLHLSQPAVSHALARLREVMRDPLFERRGNEMIPTPVARALAVTVESSLDALAATISPARGFDPATSQRCFTIAARPVHELAFLPACMQELKQTAPHIKVAVVRVDRRSLQRDLRAGTIDMALDVALPLSAGVCREQLGSEPLIVLASQRHSMIQGVLDMSTYLAMEHVLVSGRNRGGAYEDAALAQLGLSRRIRVRCQDCLAANDIVSASDLLTTLPLSQGRIGSVRNANQLLPFPVEIPPVAIFLYWHASVTEDPASCWFRTVLRRSFAM